jgi:hypothetical protein
MNKISKNFKNIFLLNSNNFTINIGKQHRQFNKQVIANVNKNVNQRLLSRLNDVNFESKRMSHFNNDNETKSEYILC